MSEDIHRIIQEMETSMLEEQFESKTEEWVETIRDPGNTWRRLTLYRKSLHIYWVLKCLVEKALEQVEKEMAEITNGMPNSQKEMKNFQVIMIKHNNKLEEMRHLLSRMVCTNLSQEEQKGTPMDTDSNIDTRKEGSP